MYASPQNENDQEYSGTTSLWAMDTTVDMNKLDHHSHGRFTPCPPTLLPIASGSTTSSDCDDEDRDMDDGMELRTVGSDQSSRRIVLPNAVNTAGSSTTRTDVGWVHSTSPRCHPTVIRKHFANTKNHPTHDDLLVPSSSPKAQKWRPAKNTLISDGDDKRTRLVGAHDYHDHLHDTCSKSSDHHSQAARCRRGSSSSTSFGLSDADLTVCDNMSFPQRLHRMLHQLEEEQLQQIACWLPHGRCFIVRDKNAFIAEVAPRFFHQSKITSFQRQLNLYGFLRLTAGPDRGAYYHELFLRSRPELCHDMIRTRIKGTGIKVAFSPHTEPNFYGMEACPSSPLSTASVESSSFGSYLLPVPSQIRIFPPAVQPIRCRSTSTVVDESGDLGSPSGTRTCQLEEGEQCYDEEMTRVPSPLLVNDVESLGPRSTTTTDVGALYEQPRSGDLVGFEEQQFYYLEHSDVDQILWTAARDDDGDDLDNMAWVDDNATDVDVWEALAACLA